ncbi:MAG: hypothetical protein AAGA23_00170 [Pseudomonadota bacterium]
MRLVGYFGTACLALAMVSSSLAADTEKGLPGVAVVIEGIPASAADEQATVAVGITNLGQETGNFTLLSTLTSSSIASGSIPTSVALESRQTQQYFLDITVLESGETAAIEVGAEDMADPANADLTAFLLLDDELFSSGFEPGEMADPGTPPEPIFVTRAGDRGGDVVSDPVGISCGANCAEFVGSGTTVMLSAEAFDESKFTGWDGACTGSADCIVIVEGPTEVIANFEPDPNVAITLIVNPAVVAPEDAVAVSWSLENYVDGETSCTTEGPLFWGLDFNQSPSGGAGSYPIEETTTFVIDCGEVVASATVTVDPGLLDRFPPPPEFCGPRPAGQAIPFAFRFPLELEDRSGGNYEDVWGVWPSPLTNEALITIPRGEYIALPFYADLELGRFWQLRWLGGPRGANQTQVSISRCPGDFTGLGGIGYSDPLCNRISGSEGGTILALTDENGDGGNLACPILPGGNEIYYLNVRHTNAVGANECARAECVFLADPRLLN